jgi:hypothetical protein
MSGLPGFPEEIHECGVTIRIHSVDGGFVVADQAGWLPGEFTTRDAALESAREANGLGKPQ